MPARKSANHGNEPEKKNTLKGYAKYAKGL